MRLRLGSVFLAFLVFGTSLQDSWAGGNQPLRTKNTCTPGFIDAQALMQPLSFARRSPSIFVIGLITNVLLLGGAATWASGSPLYALASAIMAHGILMRRPPGPSHAFAFNEPGEATATDAKHLSPVILAENKNPGAAENAGISKQIEDAVQRRDGATLVKLAQALWDQSTDLESAHHLTRILDEMRLIRPAALSPLYAKIPELFSHLENPNTFNVLSSMISVAHLSERKELIDPFIAFIPQMIKQLPVDRLALLSSVFSAMECRVRLPTDFENYLNEFSPSTGRLSTHRVPLQSLVNLLSKFPNGQRLDKLAAFLTSLPMDSRRDLHFEPVQAFITDTNEQRLAAYLDSLDADSSLGQEAMATAVNGIAYFVAMPGADETPLRDNRAKRAFKKITTKLAKTKLKDSAVASSLMTRCSVAMRRLGDADDLNNLLAFEAPIAANSQLETDYRNSFTEALISYGTPEQFDAFIGRLRLETVPSDVFFNIEGVLQRKGKPEMTATYLKRFPPREHLGPLAPAPDRNPQKSASRWFSDLADQISTAWVHTHYESLNPLVKRIADQDLSGDLHEILFTKRGIVRLRDRGIEPELLLARMAATLAREPNMGLTMLAEILAPANENPLSTEADWGTAETSARQVLLAAEFIDKTVPKMVQSIVRAYQRALGLERVKIYAAVTEEPSIAAIQIVEQLTEGLIRIVKKGMARLRVEMDEKLELQLLEFVSLDNLILVDKHLLLKFGDRFLRSLLFIASHEFAHLLALRPKGSRYNVRFPQLLSSATPFFGEDSVAHNANEIAIDRIGFLLAERIDTPDFGFADSLPRIEKLLRSYLDTVTIVIDSAQNGPVARLENADYSTLMARMTAVLQELESSYRFSPAQTTESIQLQREIADLFNARWAETTDAIPAFEKLVQEYRRLWRETDLTFKPQRKSGNHSPSATGAAA